MTPEDRGFMQHASELLYGDDGMPRPGFEYLRPLSRFYSAFTVLGKIRTYYGDDACERAALQVSKLEMPPMDTARYLEGVEWGSNEVGFNL